LSRELVERSIFCVCGRMAYSAYGTSFCSECGDVAPICRCKLVVLYN